MMPNDKVIVGVSDFAISRKAMCVFERMLRNCVLASRFCYPLYLHLYLTSIICIT